VERARRHYEIDVRDAGDHISAIRLKRGGGGCVLFFRAGSDAIHIPTSSCHKVRSAYTSHVTRPSDKGTRT
jgi:hypothetical protein